MIGLSEVRPVIPGEIRLVVPGEPTSTTEFQVRLTQGGFLIGVHLFRLSTNYVDGSGGHDHITPRRPGGTQAQRAQNYGHFLSRQINERLNPLEELTMPFDTSRFEYTASAFGDTMRIRLHSLENPLLKDSVSLIERVAELEPLAAGNNLITFTSTEQFHSLANSNYASVRTRDAVHSAVRQYAAQYRMPNDIFLAVIDMTLPFGGLFDINGNWQPPHTYHRVGKSVDLSRFYKDARGGKE
jgi:hypothetical protein